MLIRFPTRRARKNNFHDLLLIHFSLLFRFAFLFFFFLSFFYLNLELSNAFAEIFLLNEVRTKNLKTQKEKNWQKKTLKEKGQNKV